MADGEHAPRKQGLRPAWQPGQSGNPKGRPKGARNRLGEAFLEALAADFDAHGVEAITRVREDRPQDYVKVIASILPRELHVRVDEDMTDDELDQRIRQLAAALDLEVRTAGGTGAPDGAAEGSTRH